MTRNFTAGKPDGPDKKGRLTVVVETPKGSRNKYKFDPAAGQFTLSSVLPAGASFPFDFGFAPFTAGEDGDPVDILILMDEPAFPGCLVEARLIGVVRAEEGEKGKRVRNDRLIAVAIESRNHADVRDLNDLHGNLLKEIEHFFVSYNLARGKRFRVRGRGDAEAAMARIRRGSEAFLKGK